MVLAVLSEIAVTSGWGTLTGVQAFVEMRVLTRRTERVRPAVSLSRTAGYTTRQWEVLRVLRRWSR